MGSLPVADQPCHICHRDRRLFDEQLGGGSQAPGRQVLLERDLPEFGVGALQLTRRARQGSGHDRERQSPLVVAVHHRPRQQVQAPAGKERAGMHTPSSDALHEAGQAAHPGSEAGRAPQPGLRGLGGCRGIRGRAPRAQPP
jgi:hypothetical protein